MACEVAGVRYDKGNAIVADVLRVFDALKPADSTGMLAEVRAVAAGTDHEIMSDANQVIEQG